MNGPARSVPRGAPVVIGMLLVTDAMVVAVAAVDVWAGRLADPVQRAEVRDGIRALDSQVRAVRRRIHQAARR